MRGIRSAWAMTLAVVTPTRRPVNSPGPIPTPMADSWSSDRSSCSSRYWMAGARCSAWCWGRASCTRPMTWSSEPMATPTWGVAVSRQSSSIGRLPLRGLRGVVVLVRAVALDDLGHPPAAPPPRLAEQDQLDDPLVGPGPGREAHLEAVGGQRRGGDLAPLDQRDAVLELLLDPETVDLLHALQSVDVDVAERDAALVVLPHQGERRADDGPLDPEAAADALGQRRLAGAEFAGEDDDVAGGQHVAAQLLAQRPGLLDRTGDDLHAISQPARRTPGPVNGLGQGILPHAGWVASGPLDAQSPTAARTAAATAAVAATRRRSGWASTSPVARTAAKSPS